MSDGESIVTSLRKKFIGQTPSEQAETLKDKAREEPTSINEEEIDTLVDLLKTNDTDVVTDSLHTLRLISSEQPELVSRAAPTIVADLSNRPPDEWTETPLREMDDEFMQDLSRGQILLQLAAEDPAYIESVIDDLVEKHEKEELEPTSFLALAYVVADTTDWTDLSRDTFVEWASHELMHKVTTENESLGIQIADTTDFISILGALGGQSARKTLEEVKRKSDQEELIQAADSELNNLAT